MPQGDEPQSAHDGTGPKEAWFVDVAVGEGRVCAIRWRGGLHCWGESADAQEDAQEAPPGRFQSVDFGGETSCARRDDDAVLCWGGDYGAPDEVVTRLSMIEEYACGLTLTDQQHCWGEEDPLGARCT